MVHAFANETREPVRFEVELTPGHRGFEQALQIAYGLAGIPRNLVHTALLVELGETRRPAPCARWGQRRGVDAVLVERYVRF